MKPHRPPVMAIRHPVVSGHYLASQAGFQILEAGGNSMDLGVAFGLAVNVLEPEMTGFGGVGSAMLYHAGDGAVTNFVGVGPWPLGLTREFLVEQHGGRLPEGILKMVVPAAPDIWLTALERYRTLSFGEVAAAAIRFAGDGNRFSATPSDPAISAAVVPGTGITTSRWGSRTHTGPHHSVRLEPGWRPRMSANPMLAIQPGKLLMPIGSPGSEVLGHAQLQVLLSQVLFGMDPQSAVEAPRFASESWPASAIPHTYRPGSLKLEAPIGEASGEPLSALGHDVSWRPERAWRAGSVCTIHSDLGSGVMTGGAGSRRIAYAIGW